jgi:hypothetical protein
VSAEPKLVCSCGYEQDGLSLLQLSQHWTKPVSEHRWRVVELGAGQVEADE